jgi:hypothetical protein
LLTKITDPNNGEDDRLATARCDAVDANSGTFSVPMHASKAPLMRAYSVRQKDVSSGFHAMQLLRFAFNNLRARCPSAEEPKLARERGI